MPTTYIVTEGEYSSYHICGVYSTREKADYAARLYNGEVEEHEIDVLPNHPVGLLPFRVWMKRDGTSTSDHISNWEWDEEHAFPGQPHFYRGEMMVKTWAKDEEHAVKIANEIRGQKIALNEWPGWVEPKYSPGASASTSPVFKEGQTITPDIPED